MNHPYDMPPRMRPRTLREQSMRGGMTSRLGRAPSFRLLPVLILAAVGMLGFKLQVIVKEVAGETRLVSFVMEQSAALAQAAAPNNAAKPAAPPAAADSGAAPATMPARWC